MGKKKSIWRNLLCRVQTKQEDMCLRRMQDKKEEGGSMCMRQTKKEKIGMEIMKRSMPSMRKSTRENTLTRSTKEGTYKVLTKQRTMQEPIILTTPAPYMRMFTEQWGYPLIF